MILYIPRVLLMDYGTNGKRTGAGLGGFIDFRTSVLSIVHENVCRLAGEMT